MSHHQNITRIKVIHQALQELADKILFVGGATVSLYTDRPFGEMRPTDDVDILIELVHYTGYAKLENELRTKGFINDVETGVIGRYKINGIIVDVMPTSAEVLGFTNRWYAEGFQYPMEKDLGEGFVVRIFQPAYFIATKLEAFKGRGKDDGRMSSDFEDIVFVLNNRNVIWDEMLEAPPMLRRYLKEEFKRLLKTNYFYEWVSAHLDFTDQKRVSFIVAGLEVFVESENN
jgi:predicted nucleotidyltransferase